MIRACHMIKDAAKQPMLKELLNKTRKNCLHSEPNYGVLWFYFKESLLDNAHEIWQNAEIEL